MILFCTRVQNSFFCPFVRTCNYYHIVVPSLWLYDDTARGHSGANFSLVLFQQMKYFILLLSRVKTGTNDRRFIRFRWTFRVTLMFVLACNNFLTNTLRVYQLFDNNRFDNVSIFICSINFALTNTRASELSTGFFSNYLHVYLLKSIRVPYSIFIIYLSFCRGKKKSHRTQHNTVFTCSLSGNTFKKKKIVFFSFIYDGRLYGAGRSRDECGKL